jgi:asparagine synthase (glutamine-hydrolysing)
MFRYVAFVWDAADPVAREAQQLLSGLLESGCAEWSAVSRHDGLAVYCAGIRRGSMEPYELQDGTGVVLGHLFRRSAEGFSQSAPIEFPVAETERVLRSRGRHLVETYWGRYVLFLREGGTGSSWVLRDPSAGLPCMCVVFSGVRVFFSSMEDAVRLALGDFPVSWKYVAGTLACHRLQSNQTGLEDVSQILGGECVSLCGGRQSSEFYWDPLRIAASAVLEDAGEAADELRRCVRDCVQAWASCHGSLLHTISGGLDSSIVLACLQDAPSRPALTCVTYHSPGSDGDEREFARLAARRAGVELIEKPRDPTISFEPLLHIRRTSAPLTTFLYHLENCRSQAELAAERDASAIVSGNAGDQLFYQARAGLAAEDHVRRNGLRRAVFGIAMDAARLDGSSVWQVLSGALRNGLGNRARNPLAAVGDTPSLISRDVVEAAHGDESLVHPLFRERERHPGGKWFHAFSLLPPADPYNPVGRPGDPELLAPLHSQPLIELALRIPTYVLTIGGWDRAIARRAFLNDVPRQIITRRAKGGVEEHAKLILLRNLGLVREMLLDGALASRGILDRKGLEDALSTHPTRTGGACAELLDCFAAEAWARRWCAAHNLRAAA